jgi:tetratricopeptide (TPR) repeat protein
LAFYELGLKLRKQGKMPEGDECLKSASQYLKNTLELDPNYGLAYYNLGFVYKSLGLTGESEKYLEKGILLGLEKIPREDTRLRG